MRGLILTAGGSSTRFGGTTPKVLLPLGDRSVLQHALDAFRAVPGDWDVVVTAPQDLCATFAAALGPDVRVVPGGATRQASVAAGLAALGDTADPVLVHDGARPLVTADTISRVLDAVARHGAAAAVLPATDSLHGVDADGVMLTDPLDRTRVVRAQTPQGARRALLEHAFAQAVGVDATDEITLLRRADTPVAVVQGDARNLKITTPDDLAVARRWLDDDAPASADKGS